MCDHRGLETPQLLLRVFGNQQRMAKRYYDSEERVRVVCRSTAGSNSMLQQGSALAMTTRGHLVGSRIPFGLLGGLTG